MTWEVIIIDPDFSEIVIKAPNAMVARTYIIDDETGDYLVDEDGNYIVES